MYSGTNTSTLTVITVAASDEGDYTCVVSNGSVNVTSDPAFLTVGKLSSALPVSMLVLRWSLHTHTHMHTHTVIDCGPLDNPGNGSVSTPNTTRGSIATYSCDTGFNLDGNMTRTCQVDGDWSGTAPTCDSTLHCMLLSYAFMSLLLF